MMIVRMMMMLDYKDGAVVSRPPLNDIFFRVHTILHDILGFDTIITRYLRYFRFGKNVRKLQEMQHLMSHFLQFFTNFTLIA